MSKKRRMSTKGLAVFVATLAFGGLAHASVWNTGASYRIEKSGWQPGAGFFAQVTSPVHHVCSGADEWARKHVLVSPSLSSADRDRIISTITAAHLAGRVVDFSFTQQCSGPWAIVDGVAMH